MLYNYTMKSENKIKLLPEFKKLLKDYKPSPASLKTLSDLKAVFLVGPTAAGRNTLINILENTNRYQYIVSTTTRKPRVNNGVLEQDGREYWFISEKVMLNRLTGGEFLEAAIIHNQQISGISIAELEKAKNSGKHAILEVEVKGADTIYSYKPDALFVFLLPPSFDVWMDRLHGRGYMDEEELRRRLNSAEDELTSALNSDFYQFVINNDIHEAAVAVDELANGRQADEIKQELGRGYAEQLVIDIRLYLKSK